jgi:hypothetical protein
MDICLVHQIKNTSGVVLPNDLLKKSKARVEEQLLL